MENLLETLLHTLIPACELLGAVVVAVSVLTAFARWLRLLVAGQRGDVKFRLAAGLALSLEFKMAAEILKTVLVHEPAELFTLAVIILLRAVLSALIHWEMTHAREEVRP